MLDKILKKLGYVKIKKENLEEIEKQKKIKKQFESLMSYSLKKSIK